MKQNGQRPSGPPSDWASGRVPPYDNEAERAVLGSLLMNNDVLNEVRTLVGAGDFYNEAHKTIWDAIVAVADGGAAVDHVTLAAALATSGNLERAGGAVALAALTDAVATSAHVEHYARIVHGKAITRRMIYVAQEIAARGFAGVDDVAEYLAQSREAVVEAAADLAAGTGPMQLDGAMAEMYRDLCSGATPAGVVKTGIPFLDAATGGLYPGLVTVVGARPAMGKSAFAVNVGFNAALAGKRVLYVTLEDVRPFVARRLTARFADVDLQELVWSNITGDTAVKADKYNRIIQAITTVSGKPFWVEDSGGLSAAAVRQVAAAQRVRHGLDLVIIDHLAEIVGQEESRTEIVSQACRGMRDIAKELNVPVLLLHQLNRQVENRTDKRPTLADLRQSGEVEAIARNVWFLYRPGYYQEGGEEAPNLSLIVAKANHGKTGAVRLWADLSRMFVREWDDRQDGSFDVVQPLARQGSGAAGRGSSFFSGTARSDDY